MTELIGLSASELARRIRLGEVSSREVVDGHIARIEQVNPKLNAVVWPCFEQARAEADRADAMLRTGDGVGPLHGVPITIKECFDMAGTPATLGMKKLAGNVAQADGLPVRRLREAGAIVLGKTNVAQMLMMIESPNPLYGRTNNPWNLERTPGGSSGGESAIIAAGGSPLGIGNDIGSSIRVPCHFTGLHGLKPTSGRLTHGMSTTGRWFSGQDGVASAAGPLGRSVADLALAMSVLAAPGQEAVDPAIPPVPWPDWSSVAVRGLRIGLVADDALYPVSPAIRRAVKEAGAALRELGAEVEMFAPPPLEEASLLFAGLMGADGGAAVRRALEGETVEPALGMILQGMTLGAVPRALAAWFMERVGQAGLARLARTTGRKSAAQWWQMVRARDMYKARYLGAMAAGRFDAVICPPAALVAPRHGATRQTGFVQCYSQVFNVLGMPAGVVSVTKVRIGEESDRAPGHDPAQQAAAEEERGSAGMPVGVQVAARHWREDIVLAVMGALEEYFRAQPDYPVTPVM